MQETTMLNRLTRASRAVLSVATCAPLLALGACSDIEKCRDGDPGCVNGRALEDDTCLFDLVPVRTSASTVRCFRPGEEPGGFTPDEPIDYCAAWSASEFIQYVPPATSCSLLEAESAYYTSLTDAQMFDELCFAHCVQDYVHARQYCGSEVDFGDCDPAQNPGMRATCTALAMVEAGPAASQAALNVAMEALCKQKATTTCQDTTCLDGNTPLCASLETDLCLDDCVVGSTAVSDDGFCDDGDTSSAETNDCQYGHDCTDCGPRTTLQRNTRKAAAVGEACVVNPGCDGFDARFDDSLAFCTYPSDDVNFKRCLPSCTDGRDCPDETTCRTVTIRTENGNTPLTIYANSEAKACFPTTMCE